MILPTSYTLSFPLLTVGQPVASGGPGNVYEGTFNGSNSKVYVKNVRAYSKDDPTKATKVCHPVAFPVYYY